MGGTKINFFFRKIKYSNCFFFTPLKWPTKQFFNHAPGISLQNLKFKIFGCRFIAILFYGLLFVSLLKLTY